MASPSAKYQPCHGDDTAAGPSPDGNSKGTSQIALTMKNGATNDGVPDSGSIQNGAAQGGSGRATGGCCYCYSWVVLGRIPGVVPRAPGQVLPCGVPCMPSRRRCEGAWSASVCSCCMRLMCTSGRRLSAVSCLMATHVGGEGKRVAVRGRAWPCVE